MSYLEKSSDKKNLIDPLQAAQYLSIKVGTIYYLRRTRQIDCYKVGGKLRFRSEDLDTYLEKCRIPAAG